jgi:hypothetical protein
MGKFVELRQDLKEAALAIRTEGDGLVAADFADAFGPYGVPLTSLTRGEASMVALEFLSVRDWEVDQGAIPRFLERLAQLFPDEVFDLLLRRIDLNSKTRAEDSGRFRTFGLVHHNISFANLPAEKRAAFGRETLRQLISAEPADELPDLFWVTAGLSSFLCYSPERNAKGS